MKIEDLMDKLVAWLFNALLDMIMDIENENYENAANIRDNIEHKIAATSRYLVKKNLTNLSYEDTLYNLTDLKYGMIKEINQLLNIPKERCAFE